MNDLVVPSDSECHPQVEIAKEGFSEPNLRIASRTRADSDPDLVRSWLGSFDPADSAGTLKLYRRVANVFLSWMTQRDLTLHILTVEDFTAWRDALEGAVATRANRLAITKGLLT